MKKKKIVLVVAIIIILCVLGAGFVVRKLTMDRYDFRDCIIDGGVVPVNFKGDNLIDDWEYNAQESASNYRGAINKSYGRYCKCYNARYIYRFSKH